MVKNLKSRLAENPIAYRMARGAFWSLAGALGLRTLTFLISVVVARTVGRESYGELGIIQSTVGMFGILGGVGLGTAATKHIAEYRLSDPAKADRIASFSILFALLFSGVMSVACALLSPWLAAQTLNRPELAPMLSAGALLLFTSTLGGVQSAILAGFEAFKTIAKISLWTGAAALVITYPLVYLYGVQGAISALTINASIGLILTAHASRGEYRKYNFPCRHDRTVLHEWPIIWKYALPATLGGLLVAPVTWLTSTMLVNQPGGYGEMGLFNAANQWRTAVISLLTVLMSSLLPVLSEAYGRADKADFHRIVSLNLRIACLIALPLTVVIIALCAPVASLFGKQYLDAAPIIALLMIAVFFHLVTGTVSSALAGAGKIWTGVFMNLIWASVLIICSAIFVPHFGGRGLAMAYALSYAVHSIVVLAYAERKLAPSAVSSQWRLLTFSACALIVGVFTGGKGAQKDLYQTALISFAVIFAVVHARSFFTKKTIMDGVALK